MSPRGTEERNPLEAKEEWKMETFSAAACPPDATMFSSCPFSGKHLSRSLLCAPVQAYLARGRCRMHHVHCWMMSLHHIDNNSNIVTWNLFSHTKCHLVLTADYGDTTDKSHYLHLVLEESEPLWGRRNGMGEMTFTGLLGSQGHAFASHQVSL